MSIEEAIALLNDAESIIVSVSRTYTDAETGEEIPTLVLNVKPKGVVQLTPLVVEELAEYDAENKDYDVGVVDKKDAMINQLLTTISAFYAGSWLAKLQKTWTTPG